MQVIKINSIQINLLEFDWIPFNLLVTQSVIADFQSRFNFSAAELRANQNNQTIIAFAAGIFSDANERYSIPRVEIEERKIVIEVEGHSKVADKVFSEATKYMMDLSGKTNDAPVVVQTKESIIIAKMNISANNLVDSKLLEFMNTKVTDSSHLPQGKAIGSLHTVAFRLDYTPIDDKLKDYRINLTRKEFSIGPRDGTALSEQVFISRAPVDTDKHLALIEGIEEIYS